MQKKATANADQLHCWRSCPTSMNASLRSLSPESPRDPDPVLSNFGLFPSENMLFIAGDIDGIGLRDIVRSCEVLLVITINVFRTIQDTLVASSITYGLGPADPLDVIPACPTPGPAALPFAALPTRAICGQCSKIFEKTGLVAPMTVADGGGCGIISFTSSCHCYSGECKIPTRVRFAIPLKSAS